MRSPLKGWQGWLILAGIVGVIDLLADRNETLSDAAHRALHKHPVVVAAVVGLTSAHLTLGYDARWKKVDPFHAIGMIRKWTVIK